MFVLDKMFQFTLFILHVFSGVIAHPLLSDLDYSSFSLLPDEPLPVDTSPDSSGNLDLYVSGGYDDTSQNNWETSCISSVIVSSSV